MLWGGDGDALRTPGYSDSVLLHSISPHELPQRGSHWQVSVVKWQSNYCLVFLLFISAIILLLPFFFSFLKYNGFHISSGSRVPRETLYHWNADLLAPDVKDWLICNDPDAEEGWSQEKGMIEDEMVGWYHQFSGKEFE